MKKLYLLLILMLCMVPFGSAFAQSTMTVADGEYTQGVMTKIPVILDNQNHMTGFQMSVEYPEGWTVKIVKGAKTKVTDEDDEPIYSTSWKNNTFIVYTTQRKEIESGEVAVIQVTPTGEGTLKLIDIMGSGSGEYAVTTKMPDIVINFAGGKYSTSTSTDPVVTPTNNYLTIDPVQCIKGSKVELPVALTNTNEITEIGFVVELPDGITLEKNSKGKYYVNFTDRADGHSVTASETSDGVKVAIVNMDGTPFAGNEGVVFTLPLSVSKELADGDYTVRLKNVQLSDGNLYETADVLGTVKVVNYTKGDVNNDGRIAVNDISLTIQAYLGNFSSEFIMYAGDMNDNGQIDVADISKVISAYLGNNANAPAKVATRSEAEDNLTLENASTEAGETFDLVIGLNNAKPYTEIGGYISLPEGMTFATNNKGKYLITLDEDRLPGHSVTAQLQDNGELKFAIVNIDGEPVEGNSGTIMKVTVNVSEDMANGDYDVLMHDLQLSDGNLYEVADVKATVSVGVPNMVNSIIDNASTNNHIYRIDGVEVKDATQHGIYIISGKKVVK